jgi:hypothetical protein
MTNIYSLSSSLLEKLLREVKLIRWILFSMLLMYAIFTLYSAWCLMDVPANYYDQIPIPTQQQKFDSGV